MNRAERRRLGIKGKAPTLNINADKVEQMKLEATEKGAKIAFMLMLAIPTMVIHDKFGILMKKENRESKFIDLCLDTYKCYEEGYVSIEELMQILKEEAGVEIPHGI